MVSTEREFLMLAGGSRVPHHLSDTTDMEMAVPGVTPGSTAQFPIAAEFKSDSENILHENRH